MQNKSLDDFIRMISELGTVNVIFVICAAVFAMSWILLPFLVFTIQRSINKCGRELRLDTVVRILGHVYPLRAWCNA